MRSESQDCRPPISFPQIQLRHNPVRKLFYKWPTVAQPVSAPTHPRLLLLSLTKSLAWRPLGVLPAPRPKGSPSRFPLQNDEADPCHSNPTVVRPQPSLTVLASHRGPALHVFHPISMPESMLFPPPQNSPAPFSTWIH